MRACLILISCVASLALSGCTGGVFIPRGDAPGATVEMARSRDISISGVITQATANRVLDELEDAARSRGDRPSRQSGR